MGKIVPFYTCVELSRLQGLNAILNGMLFM